MKEISSKLAALREDYTSHTLDESGTENDPIKQFSIWFEETLLAMVPEPNAMVLATVQPTGKPAARVVLLKDYLLTDLNFLPITKVPKAQIWLKILLYRLFLIGFHCRDKLE
jgi:pyridoxine/pyridoxamine 5'-phosphate oxidase